MENKVYDVIWLAEKWHNRYPGGWEHSQIVMTFDDPEYFKEIKEDGWTVTKYERNTE